MKKVRVLVSIIMGIVALMAVATVLAASEPTYGTAIVDGDYNEWDLEKDLFAPMYRAGDSSKPQESNLYLRYNCVSSTLYVLVLALHDVPIEVNGGEEHWLKLDGALKVDDQSGNNGEPPDFEWIGLNEGGAAQGWEASTSLSDGTYNLVVHTLTYDDQEVQTSATEPLTLVIDCGTTAIVLDEDSFTAQSGSGQKTHWLGPILGGLSIAGLCAIAFCACVKNRNP